MLLITEKGSNLIENPLNLYRMYTYLSWKNRYHFLLFACLLATLSATGQSKNGKKELLPGYSKIVSAGINIPFGEFPRTHPIGIGAAFAWSKHRFGLMDKKPSKPFGFIAEGGLDYYFGKNETIGPYQYDYKGFTYIHAYGGIIYNLCRRGNINVTGGPALGLENGFSTFFWGINFNGAYYINDRIAITPGIVLMKDPKSYDALLSFSIKGSWAF